MKELETERLLLRPPERSDIPVLVPLIGDWDVAKNMGRVPYPYAEEDAYAFFDQAHRKRPAGTDFAFAIVQKSDAAYAGGCGVHLRENGEFEFGYWIGKPYWRNGYATEAARRLVQFAFDDLKIGTLTAAWHFDNPGSGHVLEKLGCVRTGTEERECRSRGHTVLCNNVRLTREQFEMKQAA
ncbi:MAG: GNAT family N-acetyltransferase [Rhizomicrobium sp.]